MYLLARAPALLFDTSFLLSFGSLGSIMLFYPPSRALPRCPGLSRTACHHGVRPGGHDPIAAWHFSIALFGVVANLAVILLTAIPASVSCAVLRALFSRGGCWDMPWYRS